jgi:hypothetical protein
MGTIILMILILAVIGAVMAVVWVTRELRKKNSE